MLWFNTLITRTSVQLFFVIWAHNTCLDLFSVSSDGLEIYIDEAFTLTTLVTHLWIASVVAITYSLAAKYSADIKSKHYHMVPIGSLVMLLGFGWFKLA